MLRYAYDFLNQTTRTAVANGRNKIEERLARWLLMANDRIDRNELPLTHEFLAMMLSVRRPGVTVAIQDLERDGVIARKRGRFITVDKGQLEKSLTERMSMSRPVKVGVLSDFRQHWFLSRIRRAVELSAAGMSSVGLSANVSVQANTTGI